MQCNTLAALLCGVVFLMGVALAANGQTPTETPAQPAKAQQEAKIRFVRQRLGLQPEPPAWLLTGEPQSGK